MYAFGTDQCLFCRLDTTVYDEALDDFGSNADDFM